MTSYVPNTKEERQEMLATIGKQHIEDLYQAVPKEMLLTELLNIPKGVSEMQVAATLQEMADLNTQFKIVFRGAGAYRHFIPAVVQNIVNRNEFVTAYTPYQAEISQGILQSFFEYQTMICQITGMAVSNASLYDGATAVAEAMAMCKERKRNKMLISAATQPDILEVAATYAPALGMELVLIPEVDGHTDLDALKTMLDATVAGVYVQQPNYYGVLEDAKTVGVIAHAAGARFVMGVNPIAAAILQTAGEAGADIAVGEGQPLGMPLSFGGPYIGFIACTEALVRRLPGRIVGETQDVDGKRAYVLTLQAREQHIRREKSSSSICSNEALCALTAAAYMATMGPQGMKDAASLCFNKAHYAAEKINSLPGFQLKHGGAFFHEFVTTCPVAAEEIDKYLASKGILGGLPLADNEILWCVTEVNSKEDIDLLVDLLQEVTA